MYKQLKNIGGEISTLFVMRVADTANIPFAPDNTDYQNFKAQINADEAQLEDADGNLMTPEQAKDYVKELP